LTGLKAIGKNKYLIIFVVATFFCALYNNLNSGIGTYFFQYIVGDIGKMSLVSMIGLITPFSLLIFPKAVRDGKAMDFCRIGALLAIIGNVIKFFAGSNMVLIIIGSFIMMFPGAAMIQMIGSLFMIQCMDYGEWKTGVRIEAMMNSVNGFASKVGAGIASGLLGVYMELTGFVSGAATQSATASMAIRVGYSLIPAVVSAIILILLCSYKLEGKIGGIREDLAKRHEEQQKTEDESDTAAD
jgi:GPH family glycoside/pentoside/hexuronide:cation symporter